MNCRTCREYYCVCELRHRVGQPVREPPPRWVWAALLAAAVIVALGFLG